MAFNKKELWRKQLGKQQELLLEKPKTQKEKDINNLKYMLYNIQPYSRYWRYGMYGSLKRAIELLEKKNSFCMEKYGKKKSELTTEEKREYDKIRKRLERAKKKGEHNAENN